MVAKKYEMTISRMTVDKLGVKLYDRVSAVIAELVANGYDADAKTVTIEAPMGVYLASSKKGKIKDLGYEIVVSDDGCGMSPDVINSFYLTIGSERRNDPKRGNRSKKYKRLVMGRKGVGKLAPFGICNQIEVISSGGNKVKGKDKNGNDAKGYKTAHLILKRDKIQKDDSSPYPPDVGPLDEVVQPIRGTRIIMKQFNRRQVPDMESFSRQLSQRFGISSPDWKIKLINTNSDGKSGKTKLTVGAFDVDTMLGTRINFAGTSSVAVDKIKKAKFSAKTNDEALSDVEAGFEHNDKFYPVNGWMAYAKQPYRDELMAGVRIYCRGKIVAQTNAFDIKSGFTGEYNIRSYLVGELHADWLDEDEDLIQTDRRDILWSDDLGQAFGEWGRKTIKEIAKMSRKPMRKKAWEKFIEVSNIEEKIKKAYPGEKWKSVRHETYEIAKLIGTRLQEEEILREEYVDSLVKLILMIGPHFQLDKALNEAATESSGILGAINAILQTVRVAELSSYGAIVEKRIKVITRVSELIHSDNATEPELQDLIEGAPWLINPQWSLITFNQRLDTFKKSFENFYERRTGQKISLTDFSEGKKRPDFILTNNGSILQIIEIKKPRHDLNNDEWERIQTYIDQMEAFLNDDGNKQFRDIYNDFNITLVCDRQKLSGSHLNSYKAYVEKKKLNHITWDSFVGRTKNMHGEFLEEAERQKRIKVK